MKVFEVKHDDDFKLVEVRKVCEISNDNEILDAIIKAYSDGNYDGTEECEDENGNKIFDLIHCYRDGGTPFMLLVKP